MGRKKREVTAEDAVQEMRPETKAPGIVPQVNQLSLRVAKDSRLPLMTKDAFESFFEQLNQLGAKMEIKRINGGEFREPFCAKVKVNSFTIIVDLPKGESI